MGLKYWKTLLCCVVYLCFFRQVKPNQNIAAENRRSLLPRVNASKQSSDINLERSAQLVSLHVQPWEEN